MPMPEEIIQTEAKKFQGRGNVQFWIDYYRKKNYANYSGRNYYLFTFLAGVRGKETPLVDPRGIPEDCSRSIKKLHSRWGFDAHTPTYYYLRELMECDWKDWFKSLVDEFGHPLAEFFEDYLPRLNDLDPDKTR